MNGPASMEDRLHEYAQTFPYPPTPHIHAEVRRRLIVFRIQRTRLAIRWAILVLVIVFAAAMAVPQVRAQVLEILRIGVVRIFPAPIPSATQAPQTQKPLTATPPPIPTRQLEPAHVVSLRGLAGETTLEDARSELAFPILLPAFPADLGKPARVYLQPKWQMVILVWLDQTQPDRVRLSLHEIGPGSVIVEKYEPRIIEKTKVNGLPAAWVTGPYLVQLTNGDITWRSIVDGNTLIWETDGITYRLESELSLEDTLRIAESLQ